MSTTAVFGLGAMGYGIARSILRAGHTTHGFDIAPEHVARFLAEGGACGEALEAASSLDAMVVVVLNAEQIGAVLGGESGMVSRLRPGAVVLAYATVPPEFARRMEARCAEYGVLYLDAPISGGAAKADQGKLSVMASGPVAAFTAAHDVLDAMAETVFNLGDSVGSGSAMKAVNQLLVALLVYPVGVCGNSGSQGLWNAVWGLAQQLCVPCHPCTKVAVITSVFGTVMMKSYLE